MASKADCFGADIADSVFLRMRAVRQSYRALCRALVCICILRLAGYAQVITLPKQLKQGAIAAPQGISTTDKDLQKKISSSGDDISQSLSNTTNFFLGDWKILPPPQGEKVSDQEKDAADELAGLLKDRDTPASIRSTLQSVLNALVQADREIAERSLVTADDRIVAVAFSVSGSVTLDSTPPNIRLSQVTVIQDYSRSVWS